MIATVLLLVALLLALVDQFQSQGRSLVTWAVIFVCVALLLGRL